MIAATPVEREYVTASSSTPKEMLLLMLLLRGVMLCPWADATDAFGRRQGRQDSLVDNAGQIDQIVVPHGGQSSRSRCTLMFLGNPSARIGKTWGTMPEHQQLSWGRIGCDRYSDYLQAR